MENLAKKRMEKLENEFTTVSGVNIVEQASGRLYWIIIPQSNNWMDPSHPTTPMMFVPKTNDE